MDVIDIKGDGAASLMPLLTNWSLSDSEGMHSDRLSLTFSGMESQTLIPKSGAEWRVFIDGEKGEFTRSLRYRVSTSGQIGCAIDSCHFVWRTKRASESQGDEPFHQQEYKMCG